MQINRPRKLADTISANLCVLTSIPGMTAPRSRSLRYVLMNHKTPARSWAAEHIEDFCIFDGGCAVVITKPPRSRRQIANVEQFSAGHTDVHVCVLLIPGLPVKLQI